MKRQNVTKKRGNTPKQGIELFIIAGLSIVVYILASIFDILECFILFSHKHEFLELDEFLIVFIFLAIALMFFISRRKKELVKSETIMQEKNKKLEEALAEIKQLKGIIPICSSCKMIRDDQGYWHQVEVYLQEHTDAGFSHGLCPDCARKLYPEQYKNKEKEKRNINRNSLESLF